MIPSVETCFHFMDRYRMMAHIRDHSVVVAAVARVISQGLKEAGIEISAKKAVAGALLHDIGKTASFTSGQDHSEIGRRICLDNGLEEIANIVGEHVSLKTYDFIKNYSEKEIVYYADKRVNHDEIVSLEERLAYILERYGRNNKKLCQRIKGNFERCLLIEEKLFRVLDFKPDALAPMVKQEGYHLNLL
jgi:putative nucleotidyltransferase with HDIG domain